jgi:hypothetical protein
VKRKPLTSHCSGIQTWFGAPRQALTTIGSRFCPALAPVSGAVRHRPTALWLRNTKPGTVVACAVRPWRNWTASAGVSDRTGIRTDSMVMPGNEPSTPDGVWPWAAGLAGADEPDSASTRTTATTAATAATDSTAARPRRLRNQGRGRACRPGGSGGSAE